MKALNAKGIVHRDLKPQNILLCHSGKHSPQPNDIKLKIGEEKFERFCNVVLRLCAISQKYLKNPHPNDIKLKIGEEKFERFCNVDLRLCAIS